MIMGIIVCSISPFLTSILKKPGWKITLPGLALLDVDG
jgi:hypothetical protein